MRCLDFILINKDKVLIVNKNISAQALKKLQKLDEVLLFETKGITYPEISCHPDIFFCTDGKTTVYAPNTPRNFIEKLNQKGKKLIAGENSVGAKYPETAKYNVAVTQDVLVGNSKITDQMVLQTFKDRELIHVAQGYTRCSLLPLNSRTMITSDKGIYKTLTGQNIKVMYVSPEDVLLPGFEHGFIGGTAGIFKDTVLFNGSLNHIAQGKEIRHFIEQNNLKILELDDGPLFDIGSILTL